MGNRMTIVENTSGYYRSHVIIRTTTDNFYIAEFDNVPQLDFFAHTLGFSYAAKEWRETPTEGIIRTYELTHNIVDADYFKSLGDLPAGAKPIKALSNGSIVTCYFYNDGENILIYRPNPNCRNIYHPLTIEQHIAHVQIYGCY